MFEMLTLTLENNPAIVFELPNLSVIGREGDDLKVRLPDMGISRTHCKFYQSNDEWLIEDLNSLNGTFVNEIPVFPGKVNVVVPGDVVRLAHLKFRVDTKMAGGGIPDDWDMRR